MDQLNTSPEQLASKATELAQYRGAVFYEHPTLGDEHPILMTYRDRVFKTPFMIEPEPFGGKDESGNYIELDEYLSNVNQDIANESANMEIDDSASPEP